jgi:23S rRNA (uracil1939-C5)-methyltransferase
MGPSGPAFRREGSREEVPVERCLLMDGAIGGLLPALRALPRLGPDDVRLATNGRETVLSFASRRAAPADEAALLDAGAAGVRFADRQAGAGRIGLPLPEGVTISVSAGSFFQANWPANVRLAERVSGLLRARGAARVLDLYAGAGNFSLPLAAAGFEATAVEGGEESFRDLERNVAALGTRRCRAVRSAVERFRPSGRYDAVLLDPPRAGLSPKARALVRNIGAPTVAYVSCDPATLARDLAALSDRYDLESVEMPDFFPQTRHIESLAVLSARR